MAAITATSETTLNYFFVFAASGAFQLARANCACHLRRRSGNDFLESKQNALCIWFDIDRLGAAMGIKRMAIIAAAVIAVICIAQIHAAWTVGYDFSAPSKIDACQVGKAFTVYG